MNKFSIIIRPSLAVRIVVWCGVVLHHVALSHLVSPTSSPVSLRMGDHDQSKTIAHAKLESAETGDILPDE